MATAVHMILSTPPQEEDTKGKSQQTQIPPKGQPRRTRKREKERERTQRTLRFPYFSSFPSGRLKCHMLASPLLSLSEQKQVFKVFLSIFASFLELSMLTIKNILFEAFLFRLHSQTCPCETHGRHQEKTRLAMAIYLPGRHMQVRD